MTSEEKQPFGMKRGGRPSKGRQVGEGPGIDAEDTDDSAAAAETIDMMKVAEHPGEFQQPPRSIPGRRE